MCVEIPKNMSIEIDTMEDLNMAKAMIKNDVKIWTTNKFKNEL